MGPRSYVRQLKFFLIKNIITKFTVENYGEQLCKKIFNKKNFNCRLTLLACSAARPHARARTRAVAATCAKPSEKPSEEPSWRGLPLSLPLRPALSLPLGLSPKPTLGLPLSLPPTGLP